MFVYGIRCTPEELQAIPQTVVADYYMDYGILIFPSYSRPTVIHSHGNPSRSFWARAGPILQEPHLVHVVDELEHPYITDEEASVVAALNDKHPGIQTNWFYVPAVAGSAL
jgi:hypothetical protein